MRSQSIPPHVVATRHLLTPSPLSSGSAPQHPTIRHAAPDDTQRAVPGAQAGPDQEPPTPDDGIASSLHRFTTAFCQHPNDPNGESLLLANLLSLVPRIQTQAHMNLCVGALDGFAGMPNIGAFEQRLNAHAERQQLLGPGQVRIDARYSSTLSLDLLAGGQGDRWTLNWAGAIERLLQPYRDWLATDAGQRWNTHVPPGLLNALTQWLPAMKEQSANLKQLLAFLEGLSWLPPDNALTECLVAATLEHSLRLLVQTALSEVVSHTRAEDGYLLQNMQGLCVPLALKLLCQPCRHTVPFMGIDAEMARLKSAYDSAMASAPVEAPEPGLQDSHLPSRTEAARQLLDAALTLLPHVASPAELLKVKVVTNYRRKETHPGDFDRRMFLQKLRWALGIPNLATDLGPLDDDVLVLNVLRLLLVAPQAPALLNTWGPSADAWNPLKQAMDEEVVPPPYLDTPPPSDALDKQVQLALTCTQRAPDAQALVEALLVALRRLPAPGQDRVCRSVRQAFGAQEATTLAVVAHAEPSAATFSADRPPAVNTPATAATPETGTGFSTRLQYAQEVFERSPKGLNSGQVFINALSAAVHAIASPDQVDQLYMATASFMRHLKSRNNQKRQAFEDQLRNALRARIDDVRRNHGLETDPAVHTTTFAGALSTLRALL